MTQQNTTEKDPTQHRYNGAGQENRPKKRRRRSNPAATEFAANTASSQERTNGTGRAATPQPHTEKRTMQADTEQTVLPAASTPDSAPRTETAQNNTASSTETTPDTTREPAQAAVADSDTLQEAATALAEASSAAPETAVAENIDYQAAYQEIYRDILENLRSFSPSDQVACNITEEHISEYLNNSHAEKVMQFKERREKRFFAALELIAVLAAVVLVIHYLQNNSAILVNILYIIAGLGALFLWKFQPKNDDQPGGGSDKEAQ